MSYETFGDMLPRQTTIQYPTEHNPNLFRVESFNPVPREWIREMKVEYEKWLDQCLVVTRKGNS